MVSRARALLGAVSLLGILAMPTGCTRTPKLSGVGGLLSGQAWPVSASPRPGPLLAGEAKSTRGDTTAETLTLDQLQFKGSHNSYHQAPRLALAKAWRYSHLPLAKQLEQQGVRQIELDVRYSGGEVVVGHLPLVDGRTSCRTLKKCLQEVKAWSDDNPAHLPVFVFIEPKEHLSPSNLDGRLHVLDRTIAKVFPRSAILSPKDVAGNARSLKEAIQTRGWPSLESARGKVVFVLFGRANHTRAYAQGRPRLEGRLMFATGNAHDPYAVFGSFDHPLSAKDEIQAALAQRMMVRTRADSDLKRNAARRDAALESGAHFIGSDFVDPKHGWLMIGGRYPARCNPQSSTTCVSAALTETPNEVMAHVRETSAPPLTGTQPALPESVPDAITSAGVVAPPESVVP